MSKSKFPDKYDPKTLLGEVLVDLDKVKLPEMIEKNLIRSACRLITGMVNIPIAWLKAVERSISRETEALDLISSSTVQNVIDFNSKNKEYIEATSNYYSLQLFQKSKNRRDILKKTSDKLLSTENQEEAHKEITEDWLNSFSQISEDFSSEEMQEIFSKILAGEISQPGSYSKSTLNCLELMDTETAKQFLNFTSLLTSRSNGNNVSRKVFVFDHMDVIYWPWKSIYSKILDAGLISPPSIFNGDAQYKDFTKEFFVGSSQVKFEELNTASSKSVRSPTIILTTAGKELLKVVEIQPADKFYLASLNHWIKDKFGGKLEYY